MRGRKITEDEKRQILEAYEAAGRNQCEAARMLGMARGKFQMRLYSALRDKSVSDLEPYVADGQKLKGVSTLYNKDGESVMQWVKTSADLDRQIEIVRETAEALKADIPKEEPTPFLSTVNEDLCSVYVLTDYHIGQMSWAAECGEDWGTDKSADFLVKWFASAIAAAPDSEVGILCQLGDFLHYDGMDSVTPTSKHLLDTDARYAKIVHVAIKALRRIIAMMLKKHKRVHIIMAEGNHDMASSIWLRALFADKYEDEPRITVDNTALPYYVYEWGGTMLCFHHGHKNKMGDVSKTFAGMYREIYGRTQYAYAHMGHYHHVASKEDSLMIVEQHPSMAVKDAYSARGGYISNRGASVITYSRTHGEVSRATVRPEMVQ